MTDMATEVTRLLRAQAEKAALEEGIAKGELVPIAQAAAEHKRRKDRFVAMMLAMPARMAAEVAPEHRESVRACAQQQIEAYLVEIGPLLDANPVKSLSEE